MKEAAVRIHLLVIPFLFKGSTDFSLQSFKKSFILLKMSFMTPEETVWNSINVLKCCHLKNLSG